LVGIPPVPVGKSFLKIIDLQDVTLTGQIGENISGDSVVLRTSSVPRLNNDRH
jgi:hypothetical protein